MRITDGNGARVAFDPVGGPNFLKLVAALTFEGIAYIYGALSEDDTSIPVLQMIRNMPVVKGYSIRLVTGDAERASANTASAARPTCAWRSAPPRDVASCPTAPAASHATASR
jgi:NADPH:quinone reductase-like Zn-dependent oxidoreductase